MGEEIRRPDWIIVAAGPAPTLGAERAGAEDDAVTAGAQGDIQILREIGRVGRSGQTTSARLLASIVLGVKSGKAVAEARHTIAPKIVPLGKAPN